jgi:hypothetical protein
MGLPLYVICFFSLTAFNIFSLLSVLIVLMMICYGEFFLVKSVWCLGGFLYLNGQNFLEISGIFSYYFILGNGLKLMKIEHKKGKMQLIAFICRPR